jgi:putative hydrolase
MSHMTEPPGGSADFFGRIPLFREFARLMATGGGPVNWELARQVAVATAAGAEELGMAPQLPGPTVAPDAGEARAWDDRLRLAELWVDPVTSLPAPGVAVGAKPVSRPDWAEAVLPAFHPLVEPGARRVAEALGTGAGIGPPGVDDMLGRVGGLVAGLQVGTLVGQLARSVLAQYELAMPAADPAKVLVLPENVDAFEQAADLPGDQLRLWLACQQVVGQRLFAGVGWLPDQLRRVVDEIALQTEPDAAGLMDRLQSLDMARPEALQELLEGGAQGLLGPPSAALQAATGRLEVLLALTGGYAMVICGRALESRLPGLPAIEAAVGRRDADPQAPSHLFALLLRADPERAAAARGERFCREVLGATGIEGLDRVWSHPDFLPTAEELDTPGRWLERVGLIGGEEVDLDEGLRALLEGEEPGRGRKPAGDEAPPDGRDESGPDGPGEGPGSLGERPDGPGGRPPG